MRAAIITNGVVSNIIEVNALSDWPGVVDATGAGIGWHYANSAFTAPAPVAPVVPSSVTNYQARAVLTVTPSSIPGKSLFDLVNSAITAQGGLALQAWEYANDVARDGPLVISLASSLGVSKAQMDALFIQAATISA